MRVRGGVVAFFVALIMLKRQPQAEEHARQIRQDQPDISTPRLILQLIRRDYLWTDSAGRRHIGMNIWILTWVFPVLLMAAALLYFLAVTADYRMARDTTGTVVQVYQFEGETIFDRGEMQFVPVFEVVDETGRTRRLTPEMRHADWNFEVGSVHPLRVARQAPTRVLLGDGVPSLIPFWIAVIALVSSVPAGLLSWRLIRWRRAGAAA